MAEKQNWYLICYDIRDPKRWRKAYKLLKGYGESLQFSIFRCLLTQRNCEKLRWELEKILEPEDALLLVGLCDRCRERLCSCNRPGAWVESRDAYQIL